MKSKTQLLSFAAFVAVVGSASAQLTGPSSSQSAFVIPSGPSAATFETKSIISVGDTVGNYTMVGIPDGLGAFDNGNGTFTVLMNHELGNTSGAVRAHGAKGAFVSKWVIDKSNYAVLGGSDLMTSVYGWNTGSQSNNATTSTIAFNRFCSADLPKQTALQFGGNGTSEKIFFHGEEGGSTGYQMATVVTGSDAGKSYVLGKFNLNTNGSATSTVSPVQLQVTSASTSCSTVTFSGSAPRELAVGAQLLGRTVTAVNTNNVTLSGTANTNIASTTSTNFTLAGVGAWENALANPTAQNKTVVIGNNDGGTGIMNNSLSVYVGTKQSTGSEVDKAGLNNGTLKFVNVAGNAFELSNNTTRTTAITSGTRFSLSETASTSFSRPEDGAWNPTNLSEYYFVTTDRYDQVSDGKGSNIGQSRLWRLAFDDISNPDAGGKIDLLIDGRTVNGEKINMFDNLTVSADGTVWLQEDVGAQDHNGKIWMYNPTTDSLIQVAKHDPARFGDLSIAPTSPFNNDEETSGIIDISEIMGVNGTSQKVLLSVDQAHYLTNNTTTVEGGQLFVLTQTATPVPEPATVWTVVGLVGLLVGAQIRRRQQQG